MGFESRDYYRDGSYTDRITGLGLEFTPVVKYLIAVNVVVFLLQIFITRPAGPRELTEADEGGIGRILAQADEVRPGAKKGRAAAAEAEDEKIDPEEMEKMRRHARRMMERMKSQVQGPRVSIVQEWLELDPEKTFRQGQVWRLLTCAFCHGWHYGMIWHIIMNMFLLYWFGTRLENMYGSREFLLFYLTAALCGSVAYVALALYTGSNAPAIGASGAVMGVMMLYTIFYPHETLCLFWLIPVPLWILLSLYVIWDLHPVLLALAGDQIFTGVAHAGHLGGLAFGFLYWKLGLRLEAPFERADRPRRSAARVPLPADDEEPTVLPHPHRDVFADQVDEVLRKITEQGQDSLTEEERAILIQASAKYRKQR
jgi:membrane associated rhomboid family serine protease